jgi:L-serine/L-threonine ammonia-lyase
LVVVAIQFAHDHRILVEPACGAALAVIYSDLLWNHPDTATLALSGRPIVVQVCGGSGVNLDLLQTWNQEYGSSSTTIPNDTNEQ